MKPAYSGNMGTSSYRAVLLLALPVAWALAGCNTEIYVRDGVTDGDRFYLAPTALTDDSPVLQSWVAYSLMKSTCQLELGGPNPARANSYGCELTARRHLVDAWVKNRTSYPDVQDSYLETLTDVRDAGYLEEYTVHYFARADWQVPVEVDSTAFQSWRRQHLRRHKPQTRLIGSWNYAHNSSIAE